MEIFCTRLKELRKGKGVSSTVLGKELGVSNSTITRWENGVMIPSIENLFNMCKYFDVSADFLIGLSDNY